MLLILSPLFKVMLMAEWPVFRRLDTTVISAAVVIVAISYHIIKEKVRFRHFFSMPLLIYCMHGLIRKSGYRRGVDDPLQQQQP